MAVGAVTDDDRRPRFREAVFSWHRTYPGEPAQVGRVREDIAQVFGWCPQAEDLVLVASELVTNAIRHSRSGDGGRFGVTVGLRYGDYLRIEVEDEGGEPAVSGLARARAALDADGSLGKGLAIVEALAGKGNWGVASPAAPADGNAQPGQDATGQVTWARIPWPDASKTVGNRCRAETPTAVD